jgi:hypothetical protein
MAYTFGRNMIRKSIGLLLLAVGVWMLLSFTGPIRGTIRGGMSDWILGHYEGLSRDDAPLAYYTAFWESGGWVWVGLLALFALPGAFVTLLGSGVLILGRHKKIAEQDGTSNGG